jgi:PAS domain S-box-containing protein
MTEEILESISDGVFTVDTEWRISFFNKAAEHITGLRRKEVLGKLCHEVFKSNMCESECPLRKTMKNGRPVIDKKGWCLNPSGERIPISVSTALLLNKDGSISGGAETFRDLREIEALKEKLEGTLGSDTRTFSRNQELASLYARLPAIAESGSTVLIEGETGTGKEVLAQKIHKLSTQHEGPFIAINCAALPDSLLESELFGYQKGAFTGADKDKPGRFKLAQNGTLFLDEIGDISAAMQVKLLRVLQERQYEALGSTRSEHTNARIICASNKKLQELTEEGSFRQDLYYRINVLALRLPPLRERLEDLPELAMFFLRRFALKMQKDVRTIHRDVYSLWYQQQWPGNIRELENTIERALVLCDGNEIRVEHIDASKPRRIQEETPRTPPTKLKAEDLSSAIAQTERDYILQALEQHKWKRSASAAALNMDTATLYRKMKKLGLQTH